MARSNSLAIADFSDPSRDTVSDELLAAWTADPRCVECGEPVRSVLDSALLVGADRVTHRERCFIPALVRRHPHLRLLTARLRAKEEDTTAPPTSEPGSLVDRAHDSRNPKDV